MGRHAAGDGPHDEARCDDGDVDHRHVLQPDGVAAGEADVDADHRQELPAHEEGHAHAGDEEEHAHDHREAERHLAGRDRTIPLGGVAAVGLDVGRVVQVVGAARRQAEGHEGQHGVDEHVAVRQDAGRAGCREHEHVLRPLLRAGGAHQAPGTDALRPGLTRSMYEPNGCHRLGAFWNAEQT